MGSATALLRRPIRRHLAAVCGPLQPRGLVDAFMSADFWPTALAYFGLSIVSAVIPWINAELVMISAVPLACLVNRARCTRRCRIGRAR